MPTGKRGRRPVFTDAAIQAYLTLKAVFGLPLRQTTWMVASLLELAGLDWPVPDFSPLCRRQKTLTVRITYRPGRGALHLLIDSTGVKAEGDGEWFAKKHSPSKPRDWREVRLGIDAETLEITAIEVTGSRIGDAPVRPDLLDQIPVDQPIGIVTADGAYDTRACHAAIAARGAATVIPPRKNGKPWGEHTAGGRAQRCPALLPPPWQGDLEALDRLPPTKSSRGKDALLETSGGARHVPRLRSAARRASDQGGNIEPLHRHRSAAHAARRISLSTERAPSAISRFVQPV